MADDEDDIAEEAEESPEAEDTAVEDTETDDTAPESDDDLGLQELSGQVAGTNTGMRRTEVFGLRWAQVDLDARVLRIEETKTGEPLEFPVTRQLAEILKRRRAERDDFPERTRAWVFPSATTRAGHVEGLRHLNARIGEAGGARFWFHALRNCFIILDLVLAQVAERRRQAVGAVPDGGASVAADDEIRQQQFRYA